MLKLSGSTARDLSKAIDKIASYAAKDSKEHDVTIGLGKAGTGITVHCNNLPDFIAASKLQRHCELRKYSEKAAMWFGFAVWPGNAALRFGVTLDYPWQTDKELDKAVEKMPKALPSDTLRGFTKARSISGKKVGRNERCPCGSMLKYKKCCLRTSARDTART